MEANILGLEQRIETLIGECKRLSSENRTLKTEQNSLMSEKTQLKEKNRLACSRLEKIVEKLRTLEDQWAQITLSHIDRWPSSLTLFEILKFYVEFYAIKRH